MNTPTSDETDVDAEKIDASTNQCSDHNRLSLLAQLIGEDEDDAADRTTSDEDRSR